LSNPSLSFTKYGAGVVILSGDNSYTGDTTIFEGTVPASREALDRRLFEVVRWGPSRARQLDLNGHDGNRRWPGGGQPDGGTVSIGAGTLIDNSRTLNGVIGTAHWNTTYSGAITVPAAFVKAGTGIQTLDPPATPGSRVAVVVNADFVATTIVRAGQLTLSAMGQ